jgi:hypothetical protein
VARGGYLARFHRAKHGTALVLRVRAIVVLTFSEIRRKLAHRGRQGGKGQKIKVFKVNERKSRRVGKESLAAAHADGEKLGGARGVLAALGAAAYLARFKRESGEKAAHQRAFSDSRSSRKRGNLADERGGDEFFKAFYSVARRARERENAVARKRVYPFKLGGFFAVKLVFADDDRRLDAVVFRDGKELVYRFGRGRGRGTRAEDEYKVKVCKRRTDKRVFARQYRLYRRVGQSRRVVARHGGTVFHLKRRVGIPYGDKVAHHQLAAAAY